jgi:hypothetical protein
MKADSAHKTFDYNDIVTWLIARNDFITKWNLRELECRLWIGVAIISLHSISNLGLIFTLEKFCVFFEVRAEFRLTSYFKGLLNNIYPPIS